MSSSSSSSSSISSSSSSISPSRNSMSVSSSQVHYAQIGSCQNVVSGKTRCAISPDDCEPARNENGEKWYSAIRMEEKVKSGSASGSSAAACRCEDTLIGACVFVGGKQMTYECAPRTTRSVNSVSSSSSSSTATSSSDEEQDNDDIDDADYCRPEEDDAGNILDPSYEFLPANAAGTNCFCDALHSIEDDSVTGRSSSRTRYGACYIPPNKNNKNDDNTEDNKFFCAYSSEYCTGDHVWIHPNDVPTIRGDNGSEGGAKGTGTGTTTNYCHCETTRIGGCVGGFHDFHCGISDSDCWNTMFVPPIPLKVEHNHACLLCQEIMTIHPEQDEIDTMEFQHQDTTTTTTPSTNSSTSNSNIAKAGFGVLLLLVTLTVLIAMTCIYIRKKKNRLQKSTNEDNDDGDNDDDDDNKKKNDENENDTDTDNNGERAPVVDMPSPSSLSNFEEDDCSIPEIS